VQRHKAGHRRRGEVDRGGAVMAERKADLAIVVDQSRHFLADGRQDGWRAPRRKRERVMVPSDQRRLQEDRKNTKQRGPAARRRRLADPIP
jgi:hypothetical protein